MTRLRFAPSPTGYLHVGNARAALVNYLFAKKTGGTFILRLDDTDVARSKQEYADAIEQDLAWMGISWDAFFRQTDRLPLYEAAAERLKASGHLYPCFESEEELKYKREQQLRQKRPPIYDRGALKMTPEQYARALENGKKPYWRFKLSGRVIVWDDLVLGKRQVKLPTLSDPVLIRADGTFLYTFTSVVDDIDAKITHIIRGDDHVTNTGVQRDILEALGGVMPEFAHLPLLTDGDGGPLSKRLNSLGLRNLRSDGVEGLVVSAFLARLGTGHPVEPADMDALVREFDIDHYAPSTARFDPAQLLRLNRRHLHMLSFADVKARLPEGATEEFWNVVRGNLDLLNEARIWWQVVSGTIVPPVLEGEGDYLKTALSLLPAGPWGSDVWGSWTAALKQATGRKGKALFMPLRLALTGEEHGPELHDLLPLIGPERATVRLKMAAGV